MGEPERQRYRKPRPCPGGCGGEVYYANEVCNDCAQAIKLGGQEGERRKAEKLALYYVDLHSVWGGYLGEHHGLDQGDLEKQLNEALTKITNAIPAAEQDSPYRNSDVTRLPAARGEGGYWGDRGPTVALSKRQAQGIEEWAHRWGAMVTLAWLDGFKDGKSVYHALLDDGDISHYNEEEIRFAQKVQAARRRVKTGKPEKKGTV
jgi:hypothetical protein